MTRLGRGPRKAPRRGSAPRVEPLESKLLLAMANCATISGYVYSDVNGNGLRDPGEGAIPNNNRPILLLDASGNTIAQTTTDANGFYQFSVDPRINTAPTSVSATPNPVTIHLLPTNINQDFPSIPRFDTSRGTLNSVTIQFNGSFQSGNTLAENLNSSPSTATESISGNLTLTGPLNLTLTGTLGTGTVATAAAASPLAVAGTPNALTISPQAQATMPIPAFDGTVDLTGTDTVALPVLSPSASTSVTLTDPGLLAAFQGTAGTTTPAFHLVTQANVFSGGSQVNFATTTPTRATASVNVIYNYTPSNCLPEGHYIVQQPVSSEPPGFFNGRQSLVDVNTGANVIFPATAPGAPDQIPVTLSNSVTDTINANFGELAPSTLSGFVFRDLNNNGIRERSLNPQTDETGFPGVTVTLTGVDDLGTTVSATTQTDANGFYSFGNLRPGSYGTVEGTSPTGFVHGLTSKNFVPVPSSRGTGIVPGIALTSFGSTALENDFAEIPVQSPEAVSNDALTGTVFNDTTDNNGLQETGEAGFGGVTVTLTGTNSQGVAITPMTTTTDTTNGSYSFSGLDAGTYTVTEGPSPTGFHHGKTSKNGVVVPNSAGTGVIANITIPVVAGGGQIAPKNDFAELAATTPVANDTLSGVVFNDTRDNNGLQETGEAGLRGVRVTLTGTNSQGATITPRTTTTGANGSYSFTGLDAGTYTVTEGPSPTGFHHGKTSKNGVVVPNSAGTGVVRNITIPVTPGGGVTAPRNDFGELATVTPGPGLTVQTPQRFGIHDEPTEIVLTFNQALSPASAQNVANYRLLNTQNQIPVGSPIPIRAAVYNAATHTVTLLPAQQLGVHLTYQLTVSGNLTSASGKKLEGNGTTPGTDFVTKINRSNLAGFLDNRGNFVAVNHGQFFPGTARLVPAPGQASGAAVAGFPVRVNGLTFASSSRLSAAAIDRLLAGH